MKKREKIKKSVRKMQNQIYDLVLLVLYCVLMRAFLMLNYIADIDV